MESQANRRPGETGAYGPRRIDRLGRDRDQTRSRVDHDGAKEKREEGAAQTAAHPWDRLGPPDAQHPLREAVGANNFVSCRRDGVAGRQDRRGPSKCDRGGRGDGRPHRDFGRDGGGRLRPAPANAGCGVAAAAVVAATAVSCRAGRLISPATPMRRGRFGLATTVLGGLDGWPVGPARRGRHRPGCPTRGADRQRQASCDGGAEGAGQDGRPGSMYPRRVFPSVAERPDDARPIPTNAPAYTGGLPAVGCGLRWRRSLFGVLPAGRSALWNRRPGGGGGPGNTARLPSAGWRRRGRRRRRVLRPVA